MAKRTSKKIDALIDAVGSDAPLTADSDPWAAYRDPVTKKLIGRPRKERTPITPLSLRAAIRGVTTVQDFAARCEVSRQCVYRWLQVDDRDARPPSPDEAEKIIEVLSDLYGHAVRFEDLCKPDPFC